MSGRPAAGGPRPAPVLTLLGGGVATVALAAQSVAAVLALLGTAAALWGVRRDSRPWVTGGGLAMLGGVLVAGAVGVGTAPVLLSTVGTLLAWDAGTQSVGLRTQLGPAARGHRAELAHAGVTLAAACVAGGGAYLVATLGAGDRPLLAALFLVAGGVVLVTGLSGAEP